MVAGSFFLTPATALRYERHDRKVKQLSKSEELGLRTKEGKVGRGWDINEVRNTPRIIEGARGES